jgi:hypothetical protein
VWKQNVSIWKHIESTICKTQLSCESKVFSPHRTDRFPHASRKLTKQAAAKRQQLGGNMEDKPKRETSDAAKKYITGMVQALNNLPPGRGEVGEGKAAKAVPESPHQER